MSHVLEERPKIHSSSPRGSNDLTDMNHTKEFRVEMLLQVPESHQCEKMCLDFMTQRGGDGHEGRVETQHV